VNSLFADSVYLIALVNPRDQYHQRAVAFDRTGRSLVTTRFVLVELADGFARPIDRQRAVDLIDALEADPQVREGYVLYRQRPDKEWSLTDCISFVVMQRDGITEALTADHHFEQAGFVALLK
jgi:predicted nucleic acid-binding protein